MILLESCGENSITYLYSLCDIGDVLLDQKEYEKALSFFMLVRQKIQDNFGKDSIFLLKVDECLENYYLENGKQGLASKTVITNMKKVEDFYGDTSIYSMKYLILAM